MEGSSTENQSDAITGSDKNPDSSTNFVLGEFFPYLVRIYYSAVSGTVSDAYTGKFGLSVSEWRTMAILGPYNAMSASEIVMKSSLDKVTISRAIKGLRARGFLKRDIDGDDKRRAVLRLTDEGNQAFQEIVPLVEELAEKCLDGLSAKERSSLNTLMARVRVNAEKLRKSIG